MYRIDTFIGVKSAYTQEETISLRARSALLAGNIYTVGELYKKTYLELFKLKNVKTVAIMQFQDTLMSFGVSMNVFGIWPTRGVSN